MDNFTKLILLYNCSRYSSEELIGKPFIDFVHPDDVESTYQVAKLAKEN
jgi:hypothetical protein